LETPLLTLKSVKRELRDFREREREGGRERERERESRYLSHLHERGLNKHPARSHNHQCESVTTKGFDTQCIVNDTIMIEIAINLVG
jgi:hypothetical protein